MQKTVVDCRMLCCCRHTSLQVGKGLVVREGSDVALVGYGSMVQSCLAAAAMLEQAGVSATVVDAR